MEAKKEFEFRFICNRCGNCCTDKNTIVNVTYQDILRLKNGLELNIDELLSVLGFYIFEKAPTKEELKKMVIPPIETENGLAFVGLFKKQPGACYFYDEKEKKCLVYSIRPSFCRTFPYSFKIFIETENKTRKGIEIYFTDKGYEYCEGISEENPLINKEEWVQRGKKSIDNMEQNNVLIKEWNESVQTRKIIASARNFLLTILNLDEKSN